MPAAISIEPYADDAIKLYAQGESTTKIGDQLGISPYLVGKCLRARGVALRTPQAGWYAARRGQRDSLATKEQRARTREARTLHAGPREDEFAGLLDEHGARYSRQRAFGHYNVDFALDEARVVVEICAGGNSGERKPGNAERVQYLLDLGWHVIEVWVNRPGRGSVEAAADYVIAFADQARRNPAARRKYRVIRRDGQGVTRRRRAK